MVRRDINTHQLSLVSVRLRGCTEPMADGDFLTLEQTAEGTRKKCLQKFLTALLGQIHLQKCQVTTNLVLPYFSNGEFQCKPFSFLSGATNMFGTQHP